MLELLQYRPTTERVNAIPTLMIVPLSNAGHIAALVNPPGNPKASYYLGPKPYDSSLCGSCSLGQQVDVLRPESDQHRRAMREFFAAQGAQ